jgi:hypothetical protein
MEWTSRRRRDFERWPDSTVAMSAAVARCSPAATPTPQMLKMADLSLLGRRLRDGASSAARS